MASPRIFISYRRDDAAGYARAIGDALVRRFGADLVFMDVDDIEPGDAFAQVIERAVGGATVLLVLIGKRWLGERAGQAARIFDADDLVRREVGAALARGMTLIPLLLDGAAMPAPAQLPAPLQPLAGRNALEIGNTRFAADLERLVATLHEALGEPARPAAPARAGGRAMPRWAGGAALLLAAALAGAGGWWRAARAPQPAGATAAPALAARPAVNGDWQAEVEYDWPNARHAERFRFGGEGAELHGSASFLGVPRGVLDGRTEPGVLRFVTRTAESAGGASVETLHRYLGRVAGAGADATIRFVMQTEGGSTPHAPVEFVARRATAAP